MYMLVKAVQRNLGGFCIAITVHIGAVVIEMFIDLESSAAGSTILQQEVGGGGQ